jgi:hypothetical protein
MNKGSAVGAEAEEPWGMSCHEAMLVCGWTAPPRNPWTVPCQARLARAPGSKRGVGRQE